MRARCAGQGGATVAAPPSVTCDGRWRVAVMRISPSVPLQRALYDLCPNGIFNPRGWRASSGSEKRQTRDQAPSVWNEL